MIFFSFVKCFQIGLISVQLVRHSRMATSYTKLQFFGRYRDNIWLNDIVSSVLLLGRFKVLGRAGHENDKNNPHRDNIGRQILAVSLLHGQWVRHTSYKWFPGASPRISSKLFFSNHLFPEKCFHAPKAFHLRTWAFLIFIFSIWLLFSFIFHDSELIQ